jgi:hypothetical protein
MTKSSGRPSTYTDDIFYTIISQIAEGKSLRKICMDESMPDKATFYRWLGNDDALPDTDDNGNVNKNKKRLCDKYARAKDDSADALAEEIQDIADDVLSKVHEPQVARVAIDAKKWAASKLKPKKYGDKVDVTTDGDKVTAPGSFDPTVALAFNEFLKGQTKE